MIRSRRITLALLDAWLSSHNVPAGTATYRLRLWRENRAELDSVRPELLLYLEEAFDDARRRLRRGFEDPLSPFNDPALDPAANYPAALHNVTLQGYLGEVLGALAIEHWGAAGHADWVVPAFLFRFHDQEFQHLEQINERLRNGELHQPNEESELRPGRTGDDGLAFRINGANEITHVATIESKCLTQNRNEKIAEASRKLAQAGRIPSGVRELINILADYEGSAEAQMWLEALLRFRTTGYQQAVRIDGLAYACGRVPAAPRMTWMSHSAPNAEYNVNRPLEGLEFQFADLPGIVISLLRP